METLRTTIVLGNYIAGEEASVGAGHDSQGDYRTSPSIREISREGARKRRRAF